MAKIIKQKQKFERLVVTKEELLRLFEGNPFKEQIISSKVPDGSRSTVYRCGDLVDLCRGPHLPNTGRIKAFAATRHSATNWLGDTDNDSLQRMYAISFPDKKMLKVWIENQEKVSRNREGEEKMSSAAAAGTEGWIFVAMMKTRISLSEQRMNENYNPNFYESLKPCRLGGHF